jgi:single-strand DNA-binding protein
MLNQVIIMGNLTKDVELKYIPAGTAIGNFSLAMNSKYKSGGEYKEEVSYIQVTTFGKVAENCAEYLRKGSRAIVQGRLKQERWEKDGEKKNAVKVMATLVTFLDKIQNTGGSRPQGQEEEVY